MSLTRQVKTQSQILLASVGSFWLIEALDVFIFAGSLDKFGIQPHRLSGLIGILFAPFLHGDWAHLISNTVPFLILGWLVMLQETSDFWIVNILTLLFGGLGVWLFGGVGTVHIGASILIFGYLGFLLLRGWFQKNIPSILLSVLVFIGYGSMIWGILPTTPGVSWQGHLFGFLGGAIAAKMIAKEKSLYS